MSAYYQFINRTTEQNGTEVANYDCTIHAQGAWNPHEQHMAPVSGILAAEIERFLPRREMRIARISFDIFGLISFGTFNISTRVIRAGKTIELIEAKMHANSKTCVVARAWRMKTQDTNHISGIEDQHIGHAEDYPAWTSLNYWPGGYIQSINAKKSENNREGKGIVWLNNEIEMVENHSTSDFVHLIGMIDTANGIVPRATKNSKWAFPNLDLQLHMHRYPSGKWLGLETVQQYGNDGIGLTSSILHDEQGPFGRSEQILTLREIHEQK